MFPPWILLKQKWWGWWW